MTASMAQLKKEKRQLIKITPEVLKHVENMAAIGLTEDQIGRIIGIAGRTFRTYKSKNEDLEEAFQKGKANGVATVAKHLFDLAMDQNPKVCTVPIIFYLKSQGKWTDGPTTYRHEGANGGPIRVEDASEKLDRLLCRLVKKYGPTEVASSTSETDPK